MRNVNPSARGRQNRIIVLAVFVVVLVLLARACMPGANGAEKIASGITEALQANDLAAVQRYENSETAAEMSRVRVAQAADQLAPLGKIRRVKEVKAAGTVPRTHEFDVTFEHGSVHERMQLDPENKVVHFHYNAPAKK